MMKQFEIFEELSPGCQVLRHWSLVGGISAQMTAVEVMTANQEKETYVLRQLDEAVLSRESKLLRFLEKTAVNVPKVHLQRDDLLVMEYVAGKALYYAQDVQAVCVEMAKELCKIHQVQVPDNLKKAIPKLYERMDQIMDSRPQRLDETFAEEKIRQVLEDAWPFMDKDASFLLHGDFWPGNLLWRDASLVAVTDWEDVELGTPLMDLAISQLDIFWVHGKKAMETFTQMYQGLNVLDYSPLPYWQLYAALRPRLQFTLWSSAYPALGREDITEAAMRQKHGLFVKRALDQVAS